MLSCYKQIFAASNYMDVGDTILFPRFNKMQLTSLIQQVINKLEKRTPLIRRNGSFVIVGDMHGSLHDLLRIFTCFGYPPKTKYIFLGDYVDRGEYSVDVITLLFVLYNSFPESVTLLRGNHEFSVINSAYGFREECLEKYGDDLLFSMFNNAFEYLPLVCILNEYIFCVHGGISPLVKSLNDLEELKFPIDHTNQLVTDLVWSDPANRKVHYYDNPRGQGYIFGEIAVEEFLRRTSMSVIIRAHQCVNGYEDMFGKKVMTVFSSSNYSPVFHNSSGVITINDNNKISSEIFKPLKRVKKSEFCYYDIVEPKNDDKKPSNLLKLQYIGRRKSGFGCLHSASGYKLQIPVMSNRRTLCETSCGLTQRNTRSYIGNF